MLNLLNRGLNFAVLPFKLDITEILTDFRRFERSVIWKEFWYNNEDKSKSSIPIFKRRKTNMPKNHKTPNALKTFLSAIKSEIMDPQNRNKEECNIPKDELEAMKHLIKLQKERKIIIKQCDKGAGIIIHNFKDYVKSCYEHLLSKTLQEDRYYEQVEDIELIISKNKIRKVLEDGLNQQIISKEEFNAMDPDDKNPARFYCMSKIHKFHNPPETPPIRPIISGSGSITENIGVFLEHHIKKLATTHKSYLQDTPHLLRIIEKLNQGQKLPQNSILVTMDIIGAYQNIPQNDGIECLKEALEERIVKDISTDFLTSLMELIQRHNIFEFHDSLWRQIIGTAMGSHPAPPYANIYLAKRIDEKLTALSKTFQNKGKGFMKLFKRFLDDILNVFVGSSKELHNFFDQINKIHPTLKFTMTHTTISGEKTEDRCSCEERKAIPFLDTLLQIENGKIEIDLFRKPTDKNQFLLPSSCHPKSTTVNLPYSSALRIVRICTKSETRDRRLNELKNLFMNRGYEESMIEKSIEKAKKIPRKYALKRVERKISHERPIFVTKYDPRMPSIPTIQNKHWRSMVKGDNYLFKVFPEPPITGFRRQNNLKNFLIKSKIPSAPKLHEERKLNGMLKCNKVCTACPYINTRKSIKINQSETWNIIKKLTCETFNCVYLIECTKCRKKYIGETKRKFKFRLDDHRGYINNQVLSQPLGAHFNLPGHALADMKATIIEQVKVNDDTYRKERERYLINKFDTYYNGLNQQQ